MPFAPADLSQLEQQHSRVCRAVRKLLRWAVTAANDWTAAIRFVMASDAA